jgi:ECF sigma factor
MGDIIGPIEASHKGDPGAPNQLFQARYDDLHKIARSRMQSNGRYFSGYHVAAARVSDASSASVKNAGTINS